MTLFLVIRPLALIINSFNLVCFDTLTLSLIVTPSPFIYPSILVKILSLSFFHSLVQLPFVSLPILVNIKPITMKSVFLPISQINISISSLKNPYTMPNSLINNLPIISRAVFKLYGLNVRHHRK